MTTAPGTACPCGSEKRYADCCGASPSVTGGGQRLLEQALAAQRARHLAEAETLYRQVLAQVPDHPVALNMLGVLCWTEFRYHEALLHALRAADVTGWKIGQVVDNLGLICSRLLAGRANRRRGELQDLQRTWMNAHCELRSGEPLVSVVVTAGDATSNVDDALESVLAQTYSRLELVVVAGRDDPRSAHIGAALRRCPWPSTLVAARHPGAARRANEGVRRAGGEYVNVLDADDAFAPERIRSLVDGVARRGVEWGFSAVDPWLPASAPRHPVDEAHARRRIDRACQALGESSTSMAFVDGNPAVAAGNLFFRRDLFLRLGGFREDVVDVTLDFCLRAARVAEPWYTPTPLFRQRIRPEGTVAPDDELTLSARDALLATHLFAPPLGGADANPLSPFAGGNDVLVREMLLRAGKARLFRPGALRAIASDLAREPARVPLAATSGRTGRRSAIVVLGMHRSGTSAVARILNLAGAALPDNLVPPKVGDNDRGFWEPEDVVLLNERLLAAQGSSWRDPVVRPPIDDEARRSGIRSATNILATQYGDASPILLKDPRMSLLVPLWAEALAAAGFDSGYVIVVRPPAEVARSLHRRDGLPPDEALALWLRYARAADESTRGRPRVFVHYHDLMRDWRAQVCRVARVLAVPLDVGAGAAESDAFLAADLHHQRDPGAAPTTMLGEECRAYHERLRALCAQDGPV